MKTPVNFISTGIEKLFKAPLRTSAKLLWQRNHKNWLMILTYHRVADNYNPQVHLPRGWNQTQDFEQQIRFVKNKYNVVPLYEALQQLDSGRLSGRCVAITIDDGDSSVKTHIAPILEKHNCPATIFITSSYLECERLHFPFVIRYLANSPDTKIRKLITDQQIKTVKQLRLTNDPKEYEEKRKQIEDLSDHIANKQRLFMTRGDLEALDPSIFTIALHGHEHQRFSMMTADWQYHAIEKNIDALKGLDNYRPVFALPFGSSKDWNMDTIKTCLKHELFFLTCSGGVNLHKSVAYKRVFADGLDADPLIAKEITGLF